MLLYTCGFASIAIDNIASMVYQAKIQKYFFFFYIHTSLYDFLVVANNCIYYILIYKSIAYVSLFFINSYLFGLIYIWANSADWSVAPFHSLLPSLRVSFWCLENFGSDYILELSFINQEHHPFPESTFVEQPTASCGCAKKYMKPKLIFCYPL